jgi:arylsulfatase
MPKQTPPKIGFKRSPSHGISLSEHYLSKDPRYMMSNSTLMTQKPRNIILLSADALRADHLSCYGYERETSPVLDELATESLTFTNAFSASSHTREAVPSLLTGEYPDVAVDADYRLAKETIASTLSEEGFATAGFHSNPFVSRAYGFDRGFDTFDDDLHLGQHKFIALAQRMLDKFRNRHYARAEEINDRSVSWIDSLNDDEQFFLWNHYMDTHGPYEPSEKYMINFRNDGISDKKAQSLYQRAISYPESITDDEKELLIDLYDGEIRYNDAKIVSFL